MNKIRAVPLRTNTGMAYRFHCPGCDRTHAFYRHDDGGGPSWNFDGNFDAPTFSPSLLNTLPPEVRANADPEYLAKYGDTLPPDVCHLFVRAGRIEYLSDCTHHLAGQTVPMGDVE